ncbi:hypothetical protein [Parasitella parasitica]|uniref:Uncharacterized protein n=1 Tax=Parasitella parasitica TaxID=35722 RepID=A0A0B7MS80_9FUNG|nr:hypothetical protein [Parasitella parasitica]
MTLVAIYYSPASTNPTITSPKIKAMTNHSNFTSKWKRGIALLSSKYNHKRKLQCSPTVVAAATEKILCHTSNNNHDNNIKCEDLTAKEFAKMAGIKIKSDEDDDNAETDDETTDYVSVTTAPAHQQQHYLTTSILDEPMTTQMTSISTRTALSSRSCHQIWDSDFWQCNMDNNQKIKTNTTTSTTKTTNTNNNNDTLFLSKLRSSCSTMDSDGLTVPGVIQKGRFKIVVGQDDCSEPVTQHHHVVLEWKRKRSDSSTNITTKKKQPM